MIASQTKTPLELDHFRKRDFLRIICWETKAMINRELLEFAWKLDNGLVTTAVVKFLIIRTILIPNHTCFDGERARKECLADVVSGC